MKTPNYLFETSWEVCNMVGGIYTVLSTKADELKQILGDNYITIGPDIVKEAHETLYFVEDQTLFAEWREKAASQGLKVRIGRWKLNSMPLAILVDYTSLYPQKNEILSHLWEQYRLDSIRGQWDYIEPVLFGYAAGQVIESFVKWNVENDENIVAHFHEWMTGSGVLYLKENCPQIATAFTTHATYLGRAISGNGLALYNDLTTFEPNTMAARFNITSQQSMEYNAAQNADAFTTVSEVTAEECKQFLHREADVITINGINDSYILDEKTAAEKRSASRTKILSILETLSGTKVADDAFMIFNNYNLNESDGQLDYGETINLDITIKNIGAKAANDINVELVSESDYVTVTKANATIATLDTNAIAEIKDMFEFKVADSVPDQEELLFNVLCKSGDKSWTDDFSIVANAPKFELDTIYIRKEIIEPGTGATLFIAVKNNGHSEARDVKSEMISSSNKLTFLEPIATEESLQPGDVMEIVADFESNEEVLDGTVFEAMLSYYGQLRIQIQLLYHYRTVDGRL